MLYIINNKNNFNFCNLKTKQAIEKCKEQKIKFWTFENFYDAKSYINSLCSDQIKNLDDVLDYFGPNTIIKKSKNYYY